MRTMLLSVVVLGGLASVAWSQPPLELPPPRVLPAPTPQVQPAPAVTAPVIVVPQFFRPRDLEKHVERLICLSFGPLVDDVEADVDMRRREIEVEFEVRDPRVAIAVQQFVLSLPELQGWRIRFDIDYD
ncbi:MAG: hypothetical protein AB7K24_09595 [Gemmataceae bacterium]